MRNDTSAVVPVESTLAVATPASWPALTATADSVVVGGPQMTSTKLMAAARLRVKKRR